jgi:hypothetical protein
MDAFGMDMLAAVRVVIARSQTESIGEKKSREINAGIGEPPVNSVSWVTLY